jgi:hypothetical protein
MVFDFKILNKKWEIDDACILSASYDALESGSEAKGWTLKRLRARYHNW